MALWMGDALKMCSVIDELLLGVHFHRRRHEAPAHKLEVTGSQLDVATRKKLCGGKEGPCRMPAKLECKSRADPAPAQIASIAWKIQA